ncbi:glycogen debranching protein GlgX [Fischerella thermalis]|uniref:Glycogen debranching enzyme GlgX n=1 Tax=Fischerella thermalis CCMEE 5318 TaxID=2019666 RepID=A0A2N6L4E3_9CYAN|nr:glycogen debranching protein GlgX [Fischerella thermalis]PMB15552.1 glycogen debranching enzyme GlgX [Fischerella thermalis CCMEE 5318]
MFHTLPGRSFPLGATISPEGVNFCVYSAHCTGLELLLFDTPKDAQPTQVIQFDPKLHKTVHYWHIFVPGLKAGQIYAYRVYGTFAPEQGLRFDSTKVLLDPFAKTIVGWETYSREAAIRPGDNCAHALRSVVVDPKTYDWEDDVPLQIPYSQSVIYELHVGGFTRHPNSGVTPEKRGTYAGLIEKIPYLKQLGINAVELLPVHQFDEQDAQPGLANYWSYSTLGFFAPHWQYSSRKDPLGPVDEFRDMVKALHREGIQVILDVVFNHSAEGNHEGPTLSFKGLDNPTYYILEPNPTYYSNYTGCGNTLKANHPIVGYMILNSLRYWVSEMHVDGFRFDLAAIMARGISGQPEQDPIILWTIDIDPMLIESKMIAEAWDAVGLYAVGGFIGRTDRFAEWNGPFRDDVRRFVKSDPGMVGRIASRVLGSPDLYRRLNLETTRSINFVTCHDGFTLNDVVSYNYKHNETNGEDNRDGADDNYSWNCGVEGSSDDPEIKALRLRQRKNFFTILFMSQGTPMMLMGDEVGRTQKGNNNGYCQDNELNWFDWSCVEQECDLQSFVKELIHFTQSLQIFNLDNLLEVGENIPTPHLTWHGVRAGEPDWGENSHCLAFGLYHPQARENLHVIFNAYWEPLRFELPELEQGKSWLRIVDTALLTPDDFCRQEVAPVIKDSSYQAQERSAVVLMAHD